MCICVIIHGCIYSIYKSWKSFRFLPVQFRRLFLFRFLSFPFSELRITSALAFKVLSRASDRSRRCSLTPRSKGSWLCVARHDENRTGPVNRSRTGRLRVCVALATASERTGVHYLLRALLFSGRFGATCFIRFYYTVFFTVPFRFHFRSV